MIQKTIFLIIDALRDDCLNNPKAREYLFPNLSKIISNGAVCSAVSNAQSTQFVMPPIFCQNYPLDYGGYSDGILHRPCSYIELIQKSGYETQLISSCNQLGVSSGYNRGFDRIKTTIDYRVVLEQRITRNLNHYLSKLKKEKKSNYKKNKEKLLSDYKNLLVEFIKTVQNTDTSVWGRKLKHYNFQIAKQAQKELELLSIEEDVVIKRLGSIPPGVYWYVLGKNKISWLPFFLLRVKEALLWRWRRLSNNTFPFPMIIFSHWVSTSREIFDELLLELKKSKNSKQHFHLHVMDVHDCQAFNRPLKKILQFKKLPKWLFARTKNLTNRHFLYDLALMSVDEQIGRLINTLEECNLTDKSAIIISGDHGNSFARSSRGSIDLGLRTYSEYVDIPIVAYNCGKEISVNPDKMRDSMSMSATLLHFMNIKPDVSFLGESIDDKHSRGYVVVESSGSRLFDGPEVDLFLTLATKKYKLMTILKKNILLVKHLYDLIEDPDELIDIAHNKEKRDKIDSLVNILFTERHELFMLKNIKPNAWSLF